MTVELPVRVVLDPLPRLLIYEHCPFCMRVRFTLGHKNIKYEPVWIQNDDVKTPTSLVGKKVLPIFQPEGASGPSMKESLDICKFLDSEKRFGTPGRFRPASSRTDLTAWMSDNKMTNWRLIWPRFPLVRFPEYACPEARHYFINSHTLKEPASFEDNLKDSPRYISQMNAALQQLAPMIYCKEYCSEGGLSSDDIVLFSYLQGLTIVKRLKFPSVVRDYLEHHSKMTEIPLFDDVAL